MPRVVAQRQDFVETVAQRYDTRRFHSLDETGLCLDACRRYARAQGGQRVGQAVPLKRSASLTLIGTLSAQGIGAVQLFEGALNYERFGLYVSQLLAPTLRTGDVLVLDNLAVHKICGLREWLAQRGVQVLFLPPYSPDFSPIKQAWSKLKTALRPPRPAVGKPWKKPYRPPWTELPVPTPSTDLTTVATTCNPPEIG
ncbi:MAG: IS630 family transposase [Janthinobacterium lividum]